jgi:hypothetical protein
MVYFGCKHQTDIKHNKSGESSDTTCKPFAGRISSTIKVANAWREIRIRKGGSRKQKTKPIHHSDTTLSQLSSQAPVYNVTGRMNDWPCF